MSGIWLLAGIFLIVQVAGKNRVATRAVHSYVQTNVINSDDTRLGMATPIPSERLRFGVFEAAAALVALLVLRNYLSERKFPGRHRQY